MLEFECTVGEDGPTMRGVDLITFNKDGKITEIEVMARPPNAVAELGEKQTTFLRKLIALMTQEQSSQRLGAPFL